MINDDIENRICGCNDSNDLINMDTCSCTNQVNPLSDNMSNSCNLNRENMLRQIKCCSFAVTELALYLDTHVDDKKVLCLHNQYCKELKNLEDQYQKVYGPLTYKYPCNKWRWIEEPWPWEGGML